MSNTTMLDYLSKCQHLQREEKKVSLTIAHDPEDDGGFRVTLEINRPHYDRGCFLFSSSKADEEENEKNLLDELNKEL